MLSDNRVSLAPTPKQMDIENCTLFPPSGDNVPFTKTDCPVKRIYFCACWKYFGNSLRRPHKMKGEIWQYNKFAYFFFFFFFFVPMGSLLVENRLKIIVIVREQGKGILQWSFSVWKGTICFRASFPLLLLWFCQSENQFLHSELHAFYGDVLTLKNVEIRSKVLFDSTAEYRYLRSWLATLK